MLNIKELSIIVAVSVILAFTISLLTSLEDFLWALLAIFIVIIVNSVAKKVAAYFLESEISIDLWEIKRFGFRAHHHFKKPMPAGVLLPIIITVLSYGHILWFACLVFDVKKKVYRAARRWGLYTFSEITEDHTGWIAIWGIIANLVFAVVGYLIGFEEFAKLNIYFAFFNLIPISDLDGNKIFFGSIVLWALLAAITLVFLGYSFLVI